MREPLYMCAGVRSGRTQRMHTHAPVLSSSLIGGARVCGWRAREVMVSARFYGTPIGAYM